MTPAIESDVHRLQDRRRYPARWRVVLIAVVLLGGSRLVLPPVAAQQQQPPFAGGNLPAQARTQIEAVLAEKAQRTPEQRKISSHLLYANRMRRSEPAAQGVTFLRAPIEVAADGRVEVDIRADVTTGLLANIETLGGTVLSSVPSYRAIRAVLPLDQVEALAALSEVQFIAPADQMITHRQIQPRPVRSDESVTNKTNTSQGDVAHGAASARSTYGIDGTGIGIGVLSDGVDSLAARQASGDLPANVTVLSGQAGSGDEGTAMLEIVYDLAPGANLFFATASGGQAQFAANIEALCAAGADIIVDDVFYFGESVFQDGIVAQGVNNAVADGCFYFSAAGNSGNKNDGTSGVWEGDFVAAASNPPGLGAGDVAHDFGGGTNYNQITEDTPNTFILQWSDPRGGSSNDYDLCIFTPSMQLDFCSTNAQTGTQDPFESIPSQGFLNDLNYRLVIVKNSGAANRFLHLNTIEGQLATNTSGQTAGHAAAENAFGVAAVDVATASGGAFTGGSANPVETYSSDGLRRIFFQANGTAITPGNFSSTGGQVLQKPDLAAADCVSTAVPIPGLSTFCGTSAAAPHAAAIAALMLDVAGGPGSLTLTELRSAISDTALDIETSGVDRDSGAGILMATAGIAAVFPFTDHPIVAGTTIVKAVHVTELRTQINTMRTGCGLSSFSFTDSSLSGAAIRAVHITELRSALNAAYTACGQTPPTYTDPTLLAGSTAIKAVHINELRTAVIALE